MLATWKGGESQSDTKIYTAEIFGAISSVLVERLKPLSEWYWFHQQYLHNESQYLECTPHLSMAIEASCTEYPMLAKDTSFSSLSGSGFVISWKIKKRVTHMVTKNWTNFHQVEIKE